MIGRRWKISANFTNDDDPWLCRLIFDTERMYSGKNQLIKEDISFFRAIRYYFKLSKMGIFSVFYKV